MDIRHNTDDLPLPSQQIDALGCVTHNTFEMLGGRLLIEHVTTEVPPPIAGANDGEQQAEIDALAG